MCHGSTMPAFERSFQATWYLRMGVQRALIDVFIQDVLT